VEIRLVYAPPGRVREFSLTLPAGSRVGDALVASGVLREFPELSPDTLDLGVFNRPCTPEQVLHDGDRVEIYRSLEIDPKAARHLRVAARRKADAAKRQKAGEAAGGPASGLSAELAASAPLPALSAELSAGVPVPALSAEPPAGTDGSDPAAVPGPAPSR
jgi:putative ubiquitin-RnfH superfamily antitoxin RatB of RatAB toxin-antitoxin module